MQQPFSSFAKQVLERQQYPDRRQSPGGLPVRPYDVTAHTLPLLMGVDVAAVAKPFAADLEPVGEVFPAAGSTSGRGRFIALGHKTGELVALGRMLRAGVAVRWATEAFTDRGRSFPAGTLLVPASSRGVLAPLTGELGVVAHAVDATPKALALRAPRVGLYQSWVASMDEGWTRFVFEKQMGVAYETLHDADILKGSLRGRFDAIVLPDQTEAEILNGHLPGTLPDEYTGGLGKAGAERLKEFVQEGGTLVALDTASLFAVAELGLPVKIAARAVGFLLSRRAPQHSGRGPRAPEPRPRTGDNGVVRVEPGLRSGPRHRRAALSRHEPPRLRLAHRRRPPAGPRRPRRGHPRDEAASCSSASARSIAARAGPPTSPCSTRSTRRRFLLLEMCKRQERGPRRRHTTCLGHVPFSATRQVVRKTERT